MNLAYKHLQSKLRIGDLTLGQWAALFVGVMGGVIWGSYLSPFGPYVTLITSVYLAGVPVGAIFLASMTEFDLLLTLRSMSAWRRHNGRYLPGPGAAHGYFVSPDPRALLEEGRSAIPDLDLATLWDS